jgi:hypothetical protein
MKAMADHDRASSMNGLGFKPSLYQAVFWQGTRRREREEDDEQR